MAKKDTDSKKKRASGDSKDYLSQKQREFQTLQKLVEDGDLSPDTLNDITKLAKKAGNIDTNELFSADSALALASQFGGKDGGKVAKGVSALKESDFSEIGRLFGADERTQRILDETTGEYDADKVKQIPGVVFDRKTGKASFLGVLSIDSDSPLIQKMAMGASAFYGLALTDINARLLNTGKEAATSALKHSSLTPAARNNTALAAGIGLAAAASFWSNIVGFVQMQKAHREDVLDLNDRLAPAVEQYRGSTKLNDFYSIKSEDNELIVNARKRMNQEHKADRMRELITVARFSPQFVLGIKEGLKGRHIELSHADKLEGKLKDLQKRFPQMAQEELVKHAGIDLAASRDLTSLPFVGSFIEKARDIGSAGWSALTDQFAGSYFSDQMDNISSVTALEMVENLTKQLDINSDRNRFDLPKGMHTESEEGKTSLPLASYIEQIFIRHEKDTYGEEATIPSRLHDKLHKACSTIAEALQDGSLDGMALVMLVGERNIVRNKGRSIAPEEILTHEIERLSQQMRHIDRTDDHKFYSEAAYTPQQIGESWKHMDENDRATMLLGVSRSVLETAGISQDDLDAATKHSWQESHTVFSNLAEHLSAMAQMSTKELDAIGLTTEEITQLKKCDSMIDSKGASALESLLNNGSKDRETMRHLVPAALISAATQEGMVGPSQEVAHHKG